MREEKTSPADPMRPQGVDGDERDEPDDEPSPDVMPAGAARGAPTIPSPTQTGTTTPPISGWGETLDDEQGDPVDESTDPRSR